MFNHYFSRKPRCKPKEYKFYISIRGIRLIIKSSSGIFSARKPDKGTLFFIEKMIIKDGWKILDMGAGYGIIGLVAAKLAPNGYVILTDINKRAINKIKENIVINNISNAEARCGFLYEPVKGMKFDTILSNPPISAGLKICSTIIIQAKDYLKNGGILQIVSKHNKGGRRLMELMKKTYENVEILDKRSGYGVYASVYI